MNERVDGVTEATNLRTELGMDSIDVVTSITQIERRFRFRLDQAELYNIVTIGDALDAIEKKLAEQAPPPTAE